MLALLRLGTGLAIVLVFVAANLWHELRAERQLTADLRSQVGGSRNAGPGPVATAAPRPAGAADLTAVTRQEGAALPAPQPVPLPLPALNESVTVYPAQRNLMNDPEYRTARLAQQRMRLKRIYTQVGEELDLSDTETERLFDILAEQQAGGRGGSEEALRALLGPGRQTRWQEYQQTLSARGRATEMTAMLATSGHPLTDAQLRPLTSALIAEEKYVRQQQSTLPRPALMTPETRAQLREDEVNRQEESNRRYLEAATPYMSPQQLALVRDTLEWQIGLGRAEARMQRQRLEAGTPPR